MRGVFYGVLVTVMAIACVGGSCRETTVNSNTEGNANRSANAGTPNTIADGNFNSQVSNSNQSSSTTTAEASDITVEAADSVGDGDAMIIKVENDVRLRKKGKTDFVQIPGGMFHSGDLLRVGASSAAFVDCRDQKVCTLGTGDFSRCCGSECSNQVALGPPDSDRARVTLAIAELPADERQQLRTSETQIRALGADETVTQFLIANLYSSWKVKEAKVEVDKLSNKLREPQASQKLRLLYLPMVKKNGDLYNKLGDKPQAEQIYRNLTESKEPGDQQTKAAAHVSLGQIYIQDGRKQEAIQSLQKGQKLYEVEGDRGKAENVRKSINKIQSVKQQ